MLNKKELFDLLTLPLLFGFIFTLLLVGAMDYDDARAEERHYNEMVCAGHWPDYKNQQPDCSEVEK